MVVRGSARRIASSSIVSFLVLRSSRALSRRYFGYAIPVLPYANVCSHPGRTDPMRDTASMGAEHRSTRLGYLLAASAAAMWALNGSLARFLLDDGVDALRLSQLRSTVSWAILVVVLVAAR